MLCAVLYQREGGGRETEGERECRVCVCVCVCVHVWDKKIKYSLVIPATFWNGWFRGLTARFHLLYL